MPKKQIKKLNQIVFYKFHFRLLLLHILLFYQHGEVEKDVQKNLVVECLENNLISTVFHGTVKNLESLQSGSWGCV